jgi:hypothetical protein
MLKMRALDGISYLAQRVTTAVAADIPFADTIIIVRRVFMIQYTDGMLAVALVGGVGIRGMGNT